MSQAPGSELACKLKIIPRSAIREIIRQIATACIFLRSRGVVHRDIKSPNVYISDDFKVATLLDLTVIRDIHDPVGIGTDHEGKLPVVATSRYTPPEYLFRLEEYSPEFWHAVDVYQLGGLLYDLIMQEQMFQREYELSKENRYRFAWVVAIQNPIVHAVDIEADLVLLTRRALDKDWRRRSALRLEDFLLENRLANPIALELVGSTPSRGPGDKSVKPTLMGRLLAICQTLEVQLAVRLATMNIKATHSVENVDDLKKAVVIAWSREPGDGLSAQPFSFKVNIRISVSGVNLEAELTAGSGPDEVKRRRVLPSYNDEIGVEAQLEQDLIQTFIELVNEYAEVTSL
jgi:serine/threonine protein kinase